MVSVAGLDQHPNHYSEKARNLGHITGRRVFQADTSLEFPEDILNLVEIGE